MKVIKKGNPDEDKLVINAKQGDVYRVWNDDGKYTKLCPLYLMIGKDNNYQKVHSMTLDPAGTIKPDSYRKFPKYSAVALNGTETGLISIDGKDASSVPNYCIADLMQELIFTWSHIEKVDFYGVDEGRAN